jgi:hypothetical protein
LNKAVFFLDYYTRVVVAVPTTTSTTTNTTESAVAGARASIVTASICTEDGDIELGIVTGEEENRHLQDNINNNNNNNKENKACLICGDIKLLMFHPETCNHQTCIECTVAYIRTGLNQKDLITANGMKCVMFEECSEFLTPQIIRRLLTLNQGCKASSSSSSSSLSSSSSSSPSSSSLPSSSFSSTKHDNCLNTDELNKYEHYCIESSFSNGELIYCPKCEKMIFIEKEEKGGGGGGGITTNSIIELNASNASSLTPWCRCPYCSHRWNVKKSMQSLIDDGASKALVDGTSKVRAAGTVIL